MKFEGKLEGREFKARPTRIDASFDVLVRCGAGDFAAIITNLSGRGFRLGSATGIQPGWEVSLEVPRMAPVKGMIRWATGDEAGGVFLDSIAL